jgi:hypothetical protein
MHREAFLCLIKPAMKELTMFWKTFRVLCIVQLILVAFSGVQSFGLLLTRANALLYLITLLAYISMFLFVYHGLSILNYNYPDTPLTAKQKRLFNILYLINFLLIAFLFARVVNDWWMVRYVFSPDRSRDSTWFVMLGFLLISWFIFIIHLITLGGMFRLRRSIHENTINTWYDQFDQKP